MKKIVLLFLMCFFSVQIQAQDEPNKEDTYSLGEPVSDTVTNKRGNLHILEFDNRSEDDKLLREYFVFGLGVNPVLHDGSFDLPNTSIYEDWELRTFKSTNVFIGLIHYKAKLSNDHLYLHTGLDLDMKKFMFEENFIIDSKANSWQTEEFNAPTKKNKLGVTYLELPLMLSYDNGQMFGSFSADLGGYAGLRLGSIQKIKFEDKEDNIFSGDRKRKYKERDSFNLNNFTYGLQGQIGYSIINLYTKYSLQDLFEENAGNPELHPLSIGIVINPF